LPVQSNLLIAAKDPVAADIVTTYLMGLNWQKIPTLTQIKNQQYSALGRVELAPKEIAGNIPWEDSKCTFVPTRNWKGYLEDDQSSGWPFEHCSFYLGNL
jgi:uncharacterized protein (DUF362 family)